mgnify:CR=1 FL=1
MRSEEFRRQAVQKFHNRGSKGVETLALELGVSKASIHRWAQEYAIADPMKRSDKRPQDWSATEKLRAVIEYEGLSPEKQGEFLRREGLHADHEIGRAHV